MMLNNKTNSQPLLSTTNPTFIAYLMCALGALFYCYEYILRVAPSVMSNELMQAYHLTAGSFGNLTAYYYYAYTPMQIIVGVMMDRFGARYLLSFACLMCTIGTYMFACSDSLVIASIGRFLVGFGSSFAFVGGLKLVSLWLPAERFASASGVIVALGSLGAMGGDVLLTTLVSSTGWRATNMMTAVCGIILTIVLFILLRNGNAESSKNSISTNVHFSDIFKGLWEAFKTLQFWKAGFVGLLLYMPTSAFAELWAIPYLKEARGLSDHDAASVVSLIFLGWVIGGPIFGCLSDRFKNRLIPMFVGSTLGLLAFSYMLYMPHLSLNMLRALFILLGFGVSSKIVIFAIARESTSSVISGTVIACTNMMVMVSGVIFQPLIGVLLDIHWNGALLENGVRLYSSSNFMFALSVLPVGTIIALITICFMKETHGELKN
ncbi:MAG: MFS transporter [Pseudomonadota bacterium]